MGATGGAAVSERRGGLAAATSKGGDVAVLMRPNSFPFLEEATNELVANDIVATAGAGFADAVVAPKEKFARGDVSACEEAEKGKLGTEEFPLAGEAALSAVGKGTDAACP